MSKFYVKKFLNRTNSEKNAFKIRFEFVKKHQKERDLANLELSFYDDSLTIYKNNSIK